MALFDCFKKKNDGKVAPTDAPSKTGAYPEDDKPVDVEQEKDMYKRIAIIVGHTKSSKGAATYKVNGLREREYDWNKARAEEIKAHLDQYYPNKECKIFYRDGIGREGVAKLVGKWGAELCLELHFNSIGHDADAFGSEMLVLEKDDLSAKIAYIFIDELSKQFKTKKRGNFSTKDGKNLAGVRPRGSKDRGYHNLYYVKKAGVPVRLLIEPFFGGTKTHESKQFIEDPQKYSRTLGNIIGQLQ